MENQIEDAVIVEETKKSSDIAETAAPDESFALANQPEVKEKKPGPFTIQIGMRSPFTPPHALFMGTGSREATYKNWLGKQFATTLNDLGREKKANGNYTRAYANAVRFIRTVLEIVARQDEYEHILMLTPKWPREIQQEKAILAVIAENKDLIKAIAPYYDERFRVPVVQTPTPEAPAVPTAEEVTASRAEMESSLMAAFEKTKAEEAKVEQPGIDVGDKTLVEVLNEPQQPEAPM